MPLIQSKSKKAFQKNVEAEMDAHPGKERRAQNLAIAYNIKRKNAKKKMARGGEINARDEQKADIDNARDERDLQMLADGGEITAKGEKRPMLEDEYNDRSDISMNRSQKSLGKSDWTDDTYSDQASRSFSKSQREMDSDFVSDHEAKADNAYDSEEMDMEKESSSDPLDIDVHHYEDIEDAKYAKGGMIHEIMAKRRAKAYAEGGEVDLEANSEEAPHYGYKQNLEAYMKEQYDDRQISHQPEDSNESGDEREEESENEHDADIVSSIRRKMKSKRS